jgi:Holliday junction resolvasome RuvABC DNA-binding subunit
VPRRKVVTKKMADKLVKALNAKTPQGRYNYLIDAIAEEGLHNPVLDSLLHGLNEVGFRKGPLDKKLQSYIRKTLRYRALFEE